MILTQIEKSKNNTYSEYEIGIINRHDPKVQLENTIKPLSTFLMSVKHGMKINLALKITFTKEDKTQDGFFKSKAKIIFMNDMIQTLSDINNELLNRITEWISHGSGWVIERVNGHFLTIIKYTPLRGSSYLPLPKCIENKRGLINIKNEKDDECFRWCHLAYMFPVQRNPQRITKYKEHISKLNYKNIQFPVKVKDVPKIEEMNDIRFNVFGVDNTMYPIYISKKINPKNGTCDLLLIESGSKKHYVLIKDFNKLMNSQTKNTNRKFFCKYCIQHFPNEEALNNHTETCLTINGTQKVKLPDPKNNKLKFKNHHKQLMVPFVIYADFEAILEPEEEKKGRKTFIYQNHVACSYGYKLVCTYDNTFSKPVQMYRGPDAIYHFIERMLEEEIYCQEIMGDHFNKEMIITEKEQKEFKKANSCHICGREYSSWDYENDNYPVRDHCHVTGKYRGSSHNRCNRSYRLSKKIPVVFHNLRGYDSHFIMQEIGKFGVNINVIPNNMEKYMAFMISKLVFIDSLQFLNQSLANLAKNLPGEAFHFTKADFPQDFELMRRKGIYPYDHMNSFERFSETCLPSQKAFYSKLMDEHVSDDDYKHAQNVWKTLGCKTIGDYHDSYLKSDVLLLADVFENFRKTCIEYYKLDPCHYFSSPGLAWDACLKMTCIKLDLITDIDMHLMVEKGLRGGISYIANRYSKANNKYITNYDKNEENKHIMYFDANNLYGWGMSQPLPTGNFKWVNPEHFEEEFEKGKRNYIIECDLTYPEKLHESHADYPLAPEKLVISDEWLSPYCMKVKEKFNLGSDKTTKLVPTLFNKEKYVIHCKSLELYISLGMKITKIHRVIQFDERPWLAEYIDFNTKKRSNAKNAFEKDFFKLMNNSVFGKTMENLRKRINLKLTHDEKILEKHAAKATFISAKMFNENLFAIDRIKEQLVLNRPCYVGMAILELSKCLMYDFHYNYILDKYGKNAKLLFTDTDSLCYEIKTKDVYKDLLVDKELFDNSDYSEDSPFHFSNNKKIIGKMKDEAAGVPITDFVGLRSKMYSYVLSDKCVKKCKGITKGVVKKNITFENYKETLFGTLTREHRMESIRSEKHQIKSVSITKNSLSCFDNKRYILDDGINTLPYGYKHE